VATIREFVNEELPLDTRLGEGDLITDAVLIYRVVNASAEHMTERADYMFSTTCGKLLAKGIVNDVLEQWGMDYADQYFKGRDDEDPDD
jgi:hypothetical protein